MQTAYYLQRQTETIADISVAERTVSRKVLVLAGTFELFSKGFHELCAYPGTHFQSDFSVACYNFFEIVSYATSFFRAFLTFVKLLLSRSHILYSFLHF